MAKAVVGSISESKADVFFEWSVPDFFSITVDKIQSFQSPPFPFSGRVWNLVLYPKGYSAKNRGWIVLLLKMQLSDKGDKTVAFSLNTKKEDGSFKPKHDLATRTFNKDAPIFGMCQLLKLEDLKQQKSELAPSDVLTFSCHIVSAKSQPVERFLQPSKQIELETLSSNLKDFFVLKKKTDAKIKVQGKEFDVHRGILMARSPVFFSMFENEMSEKETGSVDIPDCDPETFGEFLQYLYTGETECVSVHQACCLYATSHKYDVQGLKSFCASYMARSLTAETVCEAVIFADRYQDSGLMSSAQDFFNRHFDKIFPTDGWKRLLKEDYRLANELLGKMATAVKNLKDLP